MMLAALLLLPRVLAGYADVEWVTLDVPNADAGAEYPYPTWADRDVFLWTNAARVDPEAFSDEYEAAYEPCSFSDFEPGEQEPKMPLWFNRPLTEAARYHSLNMVVNGFFDHNEPANAGGNTFEQRLGRYYQGGCGENIAQGFSDGFDVMMHGWMCSSGHRENIMYDAYQELGTGVEATTFTQDFGMNASEYSFPMRMGVHEPKLPSGEVAFWADWGADAAPAGLWAVLDGLGTELGLEYGSAEQGIYTGVAAYDTKDPDCHTYYFFWETADGETGTFPEEGMYLFGACDVDEMWITPNTGDFRGPMGDGDLLDDVRLTGCAAVPGASSWLGFIGLLGLLGLKRR